MKPKWLKTVITLSVLILCMSAIYFPVLADELDDPINIPMDEEVLTTTETYYDIITGEIIEIITEPDGTPIVISEVTTGGTGFTQRPFSPPGQGTVVDNATDSDGKEFYTIATVEGDIFYLIIDRQRNVQNVYFLNAVTEVDLIALARENAREIPTDVVYTPPIITNSTESNTVVDELKPNEQQERSSNTGLIIFFGVAFLGGGGIAYYFKIVKAKKNILTDDFDDESDESDNNNNDYDYDHNLDRSDSNSEDCNSD